MSEAAQPPRERQGPRDLRARRRAPAARRERPDLDLRRRAADRDPRQGARAHRPLRLLVRADRLDRPEPPARARRRRPLDASAGGSRCCRSSASCAATSPARAGRTTARPARCAGTGCRPGSTESERLPEPIFTPATKAQTGHDENIDRAAAVALVGEERFDEAERLTLELYRFVVRARARARDHPRRHEARVRRRRRGPARPRRRGFHPRLVALLAGRRVRARRPAALVRQAVRPRLLRDARLGQDRPRPRAAGRRRRRAPARATSRRSSSSPGSTFADYLADPDVVLGVKATVLVRPKAGILDPQGQAVESSLRHLGFAVDDARVGTARRARARDERRRPRRATQVERMCEQLLANPLIESYEIELHPAG